MTDTLLSLDSHVESNISLFTSAFDKLNSSDLNKIVENYRNKIQGEVGGLSIYTDKMLKNFKFIGFIKMLLPNAKFIHIKRHALDNCLSCYEKKFTQGHEYTYDLKMLGGYYSAYIELMEYWKSIFPEDIYEVNYEELIHDSEKVITQCLGFMNLELEKSCLEFYKSKRLVFTASTDQVRDKINTRSIGKWEKFETQLQPLIQELNANNIALD
ncbi:sulfotransferase [bacterium AH-315-I11]|nr:sulfotransferase [bacterium AH-315-I11]MBN4059849.1 sulfotransferase [bacterium AH-315-I11]